MSIPDNYIVELIFNIDIYASNEYKLFFTNIKGSKLLIDQWRLFFKLDSNKNLPDLDRCECGLRGNNNILNKQLRFQLKSRKLDENLVMEIYNSRDEKWTYEELDDFINSFCIMLNENYFEKQCVEGFINYLKF